MYGLNFDQTYTLIIKFNFYKVLLALATDLG